MNKQLLNSFPRYFFALTFILFSHYSFSQSAYQPLGQQAYNWMDRFEIKSGRFLNNIHTSTKPFLRNDIISALKDFDTLKTKPKWSRVDSLDMQWLRVDNNEWSNDPAAKSKKRILREFYKEKANFYAYNDIDFTVKINPVLEFGYGYQMNSTTGRKFVNTRGIELRGWVSKKLGFYFYAAENQLRAADYVQQFIQRTGQVPYAGYYKDFKSTGVDYFNARGYIDFKVLKPITVTFGVDRNFIGNGERSLFLSDFWNEYLFLKLQTKIWKFNYTNLFIEGIDNYNHNAGDKLLPKRYGAFHHLSLNATRWLNIGLFEGVIFNRTQGIELQYLNPIIFYRSVEQFVGSPDNAVMGFDWKVNFARHFSIYSQFILDDLNVGELRKRNGYWGNKFGFQLGGKYIDAFTVKNLDLQGEINWVKPYTYSHSDTVGSYTNYNLPLAHPLGANFKEIIGIIRFQPIRDLTITLKAFYTIYGVDYDENTTVAGDTLHIWGGDIRKVTRPQNVESIYGNFIGQGYRINQASATANIAYEIRHNVFLDLYLLNRISNRAGPPPANKTQFVQFTIRWNITPRRYDF